MVVRHIRSNIPSFASLNLPTVLLDLALESGADPDGRFTGSGKSTSLSAMIDHRNSSTTGHILTVEDRSNTCCATNVASSTSAKSDMTPKLRERPRQRAAARLPDLLLIGEVRDRATMQHALTHALTGNLCLTTLHATNSYHALSGSSTCIRRTRDPGFWPTSPTGSRPSSASDSSRPRTAPTTSREVLINTKLVAEFIAAGECTRSKEAMGKVTPRFVHV